MNEHSAERPGDIREEIRAAIARLEHVLPGQAPIQDFVHHNTLHGYQHLTFPEALAQARRLTGAAGYLPAEKYREFYSQGRITREDLIKVLDAELDLESSRTLFETAVGPVTCRDIYLAVLRHPINSVTGCQLNWQIEELNAQASFQGDVNTAARKRLLSAAGCTEAEAIADLWNVCLERLGLAYFFVHPEELLDLTAARTEALFAEMVSEEDGSDTQLILRRRMMKTAGQRLKGLLERVGGDLTLRGLLQALTGRDLLEELQPYLIRQLGSFLDQGMAAWHHNTRAAGFYSTWRGNGDDNPTWVLEEFSDWHHHLDELPDDPLEAIVEELERLDLPRERWANYLERLALELPGWSGMFLWRHLHPSYQGWMQRIDMLDYLAVRLVLERLFALRICAAEWGIEPSMDLLRWHFRRSPSEFLVRHALFSERLPEYLATRAQRLMERARSEDRPEENDSRWQRLARMIWAWQQSIAVDRSGHSVFRSAWPLFRLSQHLGLPGRELRSLERPQIDAVFDCLHRLDDDTAGFIWLRAYENHYRDWIFNAIVNNHGRGRWSDRGQRPSAQIVFCMDDREEGTRRHIEEIDPSVETLGAAAHFGVPHNYRGLDDTRASALTPVVFVPCHEIRENARPGIEPLLNVHRRRRGWRLRLRDTLHHEIRRNLVSSAVAIAAAAPVAALSLTGKVLVPRLFGRFAQRLQRRFERDIPTNIAFTIEHYDGEPTPDNVQLGFTTEEQVQRVGNFLRTMGLDHGFAPLVVMMGHGSGSDNNPHLAAYNCGACSGNHSGQNARLFAAMSNRREVRALLGERGIMIPDDCWFIGAEHNTCSEEITWYDLDRVPASLREAFGKLDRALQRAIRRHAHERCRKFFSAPANPTPEQALNHVIERGMDFSQARPELGHATNACAFIGRRAVSQGAFFDRRAFLISYDPTRDPDGSVLETLLLANGPVGAGINLEYYFSTVDNERYGAGSKVTHNVAGFLGVMDGACSDLRTGLPRQMIEIHEAMRLLVIVEAGIEVLAAIYRRQPPLQELIGNGWLLLAAKDPDSDVIQMFDPAKGWVRWEGTATPMPMVDRSSDYYSGTMGPLEPVLIAQKTVG